MAEFRTTDAARRHFIIGVSAATGAAAIAQSPLAWGKGGVAKALLPYTPKTLTEPEVATVAEDDWAIDRFGERQPQHSGPGW